jgi:hypothetical protein
VGLRPGRSRALRGSRSRDVPGAGRLGGEAGVDFIVSETNDYLREALIGLEVIREHGLPAVVTFASTGDETIDGYEFEEACKRVEAGGADVVGLNCSRGPATMLPILERIRAAVSCHVAAQPVPYRTTPDESTFLSLHAEDGTHAFPVALDPFVLTRFEMAEFAVAARDVGVGFIGICCGGAPHHVRSMAEALGRTLPASRYSPAMELHPVLGEASRSGTGASRAGGAERSRVDQLAERFEIAWDQLLLSHEGDALPDEAVRAAAAGAEPFGCAKVNRLASDQEPDRQQPLAELDHLGEATSRERRHRRPILDPLGVRRRGELEGNRVRQQARLGGQALSGNAKLPE